MNPRHLLGIALLSAAFVAACSGGSDPSSLGGVGTNGRTNNPADPSGSDPTGTGSTPGSTSTSGTPTPTNSPTGKAYFIANVYPFLSSSCGGCHAGSGTGGAPTWLAADADKSYAMVFSLGYVTLDSRILNKGPHGGVTTNVLSSDQKTTFTTWVQQELKDGGQKATPNVLEKIATCMDPALFASIGLENLRTIQRTNNNNTNNVTPWAENANRCTGCNQAACRDCHTADPGSNFVMAIGYPGQLNGMSAADYTFAQSKLTNPAFLQHYFGVDATGNPVASNGIQNKAEATSKGTAYTHPYFKLNAQQIANIQAFTDDAIAKYKAGTCTGTAATP
jgi:hypothetical protein